MPRKQPTRSTPSRASKGGIRALERSLQFLTKTQDNLGRMQESLEELRGIMSKAAEEPRREDRPAPRGTTASRSARQTSHAKGRRRSSATSGKKMEGRRASKGARAARSGGQRSDRLSRSTQYAKWIESPDDHEDRPGQSLVTRNHEVIRQWAEERGASPATISGTQDQARPRVLRLDFPGYGGEELEKISWEEWFEPFDERNLAFHFQEHKTDGTLSNFFRLDSPDREDA
jgi:hypothetical protein